LKKLSPKCKSVWYPELTTVPFQWFISNSFAHWVCVFVVSVVYYVLLSGAHKWLITTSITILIFYWWASLTKSLNSSFVPKPSSINVKSNVQYPWYSLFFNTGVIHNDVIPKSLNYCNLFLIPAISPPCL